MRGLLSAARKKLPYFNGTLPGTLEKSKGSASVKWRRIENLAAATSALSEVTGTAAAFLGRSAVQPTITDVNVAMAKYGNAILTTEEVDLYNVNSKTAQLMETLGANAGESLNILMRDVFDSGATEVRYAGGVASASAVAAAITANDIKYAVNWLNRNSAMTFTPFGYGSQNYNTSPIRSSYYGICHPDVEEDIRDLSGFVPVEQYGGYTATEPFEFGTVGGVRWAVTEIAPITSNASGTSDNALRSTSGNNLDVYKSFIYGREAVGSVGLGNMHAKSSMEMYNPMKPPAVELIQHAPGSSGIFDMYNEMGSIAWKSFFAGKVLNANWIVEVQTAASSLA
jgi:N4-gp56 family major capsid protein